MRKHLLLGIPRLENEFYSTSAKFPFCQFFVAILLYILQLLSCLGKPDKQGIKWGMSNVFQSKGNINSKLIEWSKKYNVTHLNYHYKTTSGLYKSQGQDNITDEVFICNYQTKKNTLF